MRKVRHRRVKEFALGYTVGKWQSQTWAQGTYLQSLFSCPLCHACSRKEPAFCVWVSAEASEQEEEHGDWKGGTGEMTKEVGKDSCLKFTHTFLKAKRLSPVARGTLFWIRSLDKAKRCNLGMGCKTSWKGVPQVFFIVIMLQISRITQRGAKVLLEPPRSPTKTKFEERWEEIAHGEVVYTDPNSSN